RASPRAPHRLRGRGSGHAGRAPVDCETARLAAGASRVGRRLELQIRLRERERGWRPGIDGVGLPARLGRPSPARLHRAPIARGRPLARHRFVVSDVASLGPDAGRARGLDAFADVRGREALVNEVGWFEVTGKDGKKLQKFYGDLFDWK